MSSRRVWAQHVHVTANPLHEKKHKEKLGEDKA